MNTMITIRTDTKLKNEAQKLATSLGIPISAILNNYLKEFVLNRRILFADPLVPNARTQKRLNRIIKDIDAGKNLSRPFFNAKDAIDHLMNL